MQRDRDHRPQRQGNQAKSDEELESVTADRIETHALSSPERGSPCCSGHERIATIPECYDSGEDVLNFRNRARRSGTLNDFSYLALPTLGTLMGSAKHCGPAVLRLFRRFHVA